MCVCVHGQKGREGRQTRELEWIYSNITSVCLARYGENACGERDRLKKKRNFSKILAVILQDLCMERERERETFRRFIRILMLSSELT